MSRLREGERMELEGVVERIRYEAEDGEFQVVIIATRNRGRQTVIVRGVGLRNGENVTIAGVVKAFRSGELQLEAEQVERVLPKTLDGVEAYLASGMVKGIGPAMAARIVKTFGAATIDVLNRHPERLAEVPGLGPKRREALREAWADAAVVREVMMYLQSRGVSSTWAARIFKAYGARAVRVLEEEPYRLARDIRGIGFLTADTIARRGGMAENDPRRIAAGIEYILDSALGEGHTILPGELLCGEAATLLEADLPLVESIRDRLVAAGRLVLEPMDSGEDGYMLAPIREEEVELAARLLSLSRADSSIERVGADELAQVEGSLGFALSQGQGQALRRLLGQGVSVLTGGPGTGKTTIVRAVLELVRRQKKRVLLAAPTGRAAKRMSESTGIEAKTLHRLLGFDPRSGQFTHDESEPIEADLLVVDEASMLDQALALSLVRAIRPGTALLLVGDVEQLPSVGAGDVLRDLIASEQVEVARLDAIFRQAATSEIIACAHAIRQGELMTPSREADGEYFFIEAGEPERVLEMVKRVVVERLPQAFGLSPFEDVQVLTPMNSGPLGTRSLNVVLQEALGISGPALVRGERRLHVGDKVMQVRNNYDLDVFNGDIGFVRAIDTNSIRAVVEMDGRLVEYSTADLDDLSLAYAVTVHKSQGSEFRAVVLVLSTHHFRLLQRNLVYTAITRARERLVIVGMSRALRMAADGVGGSVRHTRLRARLESG